MIAPVTGGDVLALEGRPYAWCLWIYLQVRLLERQRRAYEAVDREELVYGIATGMHDPGRLAQWRQDLRKNAGLLMSPQNLKAMAQAIVQKLDGVVWESIHE